jgi:hypothetical protein
MEGQGPYFDGGNEPEKPHGVWEWLSEHNKVKCLLAIALGLVCLGKTFDIALDWILFMVGVVLAMYGILCLKGISVERAAGSFWSQVKR